jgi:thiamine biosynthesis lipoprotein
MPLVEALPVGPDTAQWDVWGTTARIVVTDPAKRAAARALVEVVGVALAAAERSNGDVDPTVGAAMAALGYDRDLSELPAQGPVIRLVTRPAPGWRRVRLDGRRLVLPAGLRLDLGATAKAYTADRCAELVAARCEVGVLVGLGGDIATAGPAPEGGWRILVQDRPGDPHCTVALPGGAALATSSIASRQWRRGNRLLHHILDPRTCQPAAPVWRTVSVVAQRCVDANTLTTAALVRGHAALPWLWRSGLPARLVTAGGDLVTLGGWPEETTR